MATLSICSYTIEIASLWSTLAACRIRADRWRLVQPSVKTFSLPARKHIKHSIAVSPFRTSYINSSVHFERNVQWRCHVSPVELSGICSVSLAAFVFSLRAWLCECIKHCLLSLHHFDSRTSCVLPQFQCSSFIIAHASDPVSLWSYFCHFCWNFISVFWPLKWKPHQLNWYLSFFCMKEKITFSAQQSFFNTGRHSYSGIPQGVC